MWTRRDLGPTGIVVKAGLFLLAIGGAAAGLLVVAPSPRTAFLIAVLVWASARFYYALFYALERYVDPSLRYAGILALLGRLLGSASRGRNPRSVASRGRPSEDGSD